MDGSNILVPPRREIFAAPGEQVKINCTLAPYVNSSVSLDDFRYQWSATDLVRDDNNIVKRIIYSASANSSKFIFVSFHLQLASEILNLLNAFPLNLIEN